MQRFILCLLLTASVFSARAQSASGSDRIRKFVQGACPSYAAKLNSDPILADALKSREISSEALCRCIDEKFSEDKKLEVALDVDEATLMQLVKSKQFESYTMLRLMHSGMTCLAPQLESALDAAKPSD